MPYIDPVNTSAPGPAGELLAAVRKKLGVVPNIFATLANSPAALESFLAFSGALEKGLLSGTQREQIALTVAGVNGCDYCASAHSFIARSLGVDDAEAARNLAASSSDPKTAAILDFAASVVENRARLENNAAALDDLREAGVSDAEIVEIIANIAVNLFTNYFNHIAATDIDFPVVDSKSARAAA